MIQNLLSKKTICLFGVGELIIQCFQQIKLILGRSPDFFCDNSQDKWGKMYAGIKCIPPSELIKYSHQLVVIITIRNYESPYRQLLSMGIKDIYILCYDRSYDIIHSIKKIKSNKYVKFNIKDFTISLEKKWILITGSTRGIGKKIAIEIAKQGSKIIAHGRLKKHTDDIVEQCRSIGVDVIPIGADFSQISEVDQMLSELETLVPQVDIVFNNAAISPPSPSGFWSMPAKDFIDTFTINTLAPIRICQKLIPQMIKRKFGRIINISSAIQKRPGEMAYACSKGALNKFVFDLAPSLDGTGVMISLVNPGWVRTDMGGEQAIHDVDSVIPGVLLGAMLSTNVNGSWFGAQDYAGFTIEEAIKRSQFYML